MLVSTKFTAITWLFSIKFVFSGYSIFTFGKLRIIFQSLTDRNRQTKEQTCFRDSDTSWITTRGNFLKWIATVMKIQYPEPCRHKLYVVKSQVESNIFGTIHGDGKDFNVERQLVTFIKGLLVIPVWDQTLKYFFITSIESIFKLCILRHMTVKTGAKTSIKVCHNATTICLAKESILVISNDRIKWTNNTIFW